MTRVLVLGGGPDAEREISLQSSRAVYEACIEGGIDAQYLAVDRPTIEEVGAWDASVIFPVLHGRFGEGGELQRMMEICDRAFVGCGSRASKLAMDKLGTKLLASTLGIPTPVSATLDPVDAQHPEHAVCPIELPVVIKPVAEGSSVGLYMCDTHADWVRALTSIRSDNQRVSMIEQRIHGRELTVGVLGGMDADHPGKLTALPIIEIAPKSGTYDFEAKYGRSDTVYTPNPELPTGVAATIQEQSVRLCERLGVRHLARVDFLMPRDGSQPMVLEVNTMPGFTGTSLYPMACKACGIGLPALCAQFVQLAEDDAQREREGRDAHGEEKETQIKQA